MRRLYTLGGKGGGGEIVAVCFGLSVDPEVEALRLAESMPFETTLLGVEETPGSDVKLKRLRVRWAEQHLHGPWYKPNDAMWREYLKKLRTVDPKRKGPKRVNLFLTLVDFMTLEQAAKDLAMSKSKLLREAFKIFIQIASLQSMGYDIQAIKEDHTIRLPNFLDPFRIL